MNEAANGLSKAKSVSGERLRYEIAGGAFRLIVTLDFKRQIAFVKFAGAYGEYDDTTVEMF